MKETVKYNQMQSPPLQHYPLQMCFADIVYKVDLYSGKPPSFPSQSWLYKSKKVELIIWPVTGNACEQFDKTQMHTCKYTRAHT